MAQNGQQDEQRLALFIDFENIAIGVRDAHYRKFDVNLVLERLLDKGKLLVKKAYADWSRYSDYKRAFHEAAIELIEVPQKSVGGKNSADIRLVRGRHGHVASRRSTSTASWSSPATATSRRSSPSSRRTTSTSSGWG